MPRKSKDELKNEIKNVTESTIVETVSKKTATKTATKKTSSKSKETAEVTPKKTTKTKKVDLEATKDTKKTTVKKATNKKSSDEKDTTKKSVTKKTANTKSASSKAKVEKDTESKKTTKKASTKKSAADETVTKKATSKKSTTKKATAKKTTTKKTASKKATTKKASSSKTEIISNAEYYDLPYRYNQTTVKILAQTPTMLFIYWDISDEDRNSYIQTYGESFFNDTKPVLLITNKTMNYSFEVEINDFANSWYLPLNDADCDYSVELGRRPKYNVNNTYNSNNSSDTNYHQPLSEYIHICTSNAMEMPNNHILFDKLGKSVFFKNVKNNFVEERFISSLSFITNIGKIYNVYDLYKELYKDDLNIEELSSDNLKLNLSSSNSPSSPTYK